MMGAGEHAALQVGPGRVSLDADRHQASAAMRTLYWQLRWRGSRGIGERGLVLAHRALLPLIAIKHAWRGTRAHGARVATIAGVSRRRQFLQLLGAAARYGQDSDTYYRYRLYRLPDVRSTGLFLPLQVNMLLREHLLDRLGVDRTRLGDKRNFYRTCVANGITTARTVLDADAGAVRWWTGFEQQALPPCDLFSKEANNIKGRGAARWLWQGDGRYRDEEGAVLDGADVVAHLARQSRDAPHLLQVRIVNHPLIARIAPETLCTVRVVTYRPAPEAEPAHLASVFRMAGGPFAADNFSQRGLASRVDEATGQLGPALFKALPDTAVDHREHPVFGTPIDGFRLPHWEGVRELALRAHRVFREFPSVGWDVAITPDGPLLLEGNYNWNVVLIQQPGGWPLGGTDFADSYFAWLEHATAT
jgi:hypothetical protein